MKRALNRLCTFAALGLLAATCSAAPAAADTTAGARIASAGTPNGATACASCHGAQGEGAGAFPRLAGTGSAYLRAQLDAFAGGARKNAIMQPIAQALSPGQRAQVAAHYASLPARVAATDRPPARSSDAGAWLATRGRWADGVPACAQCHGPGGSGVGEQFPPLAGQTAAYIAAQLQAWQSGARPAGPLGLMEAVARKLTPGDIQAVSEYYASLASSGAPAAVAGKEKP